MPLTSKQEDEVRERVIQQFGEDCVKKIDAFYVELNGLRFGCKDSYEFLDRVIKKFPGENHELLVAAILYGMKQGELGYEYHLRMKATEAEKIDRIVQEQIPHARPWMAS